MRRWDRPRNVWKLRGTKNSEFSGEIIVRIFILWEPRHFKTHYIQEWFTNTGTMFLTLTVSPSFLYEISFALCSRKKTLCTIYFRPPKIYSVALWLTLNPSFLHNLSELSSFLIYFCPPNIFQYEISVYHAHDTARPRAKFIRKNFSPSKIFPKNIFTP